MRFPVLSQKKRVSAFSWVVKNLHCSTQDSAEALNKRIRLKFPGAEKIGTTLRLVVFNCNTGAWCKVQQLLKHQGENVCIYLAHGVAKKRSQRGVRKCFRKIQVGFAPRKFCAGCPRKCQEQECCSQWETKSRDTGLFMEQIQLGCVFQSSGYL